MVTIFIERRLTVYCIITTSYYTICHPPNIRFYLKKQEPIGRIPFSLEALSVTTYTRVPNTTNGTNTFGLKLWSAAMRVECPNKTKQTNQISLFQKYN